VTVAPKTCSLCERPALVQNGDEARCDHCAELPFVVADQKPVAAQAGVKHDAGKLRWHMLPWHALEQVVKVLEAGARKYSEGNWKSVPNARERYFDAAIRHLTAWWGGERLDLETKLPHLAHAGCCVLFLLSLDEKAAGADKPMPDPKSMAGGQQCPTCAAMPAGANPETCSTCAWAAWPPSDGSHG
jgi:hypothetical protein